MEEMIMKVHVEHHDKTDRLLVLVISLLFLGLILFFVQSGATYSSRPLSVSAHPSLYEPVESGFPDLMNAWFVFGNNTGLIGPMLEVKDWMMTLDGWGLLSVSPPGEEYEESLLAVASWMTSLDDWVNPGAMEHWTRIENWMLDPTGWESSPEFIDPKAWMFDLSLW